MAVEVILPKVDMVMETGTFVEWLKQEGDHVDKGEPLFVISTDKAAMEIESPATGVLAGLKAKRDDVIPVTTTLAYILEPGEEPLAAAKQASRSVPDALAVPDAPPPTPSPGSGEGERGFRRVVVVAPPPPLSGPQIPRSPQGSGAGGEGPGKPRATPVARRMAAELGIDLHGIVGRGPGGRIHKADVLLAVEKLKSKQAAPPAVPAASGITILLPEARQKGVVPLVGARKIIAERMAYSASTAPHINLTLSVDMSEASRLRGQLRPEFEKAGLKLSFTAIIARAVAFVLRQHPYLNASLSGDSIVLWEDIHLGIATSLRDNLIVPVIREAQSKGLREIASEFAALVERARARRLTPAEMSGSTFTISNLGMYGIESFTSILNPPEVAILSVGKIVDRPVAAGEGMALRPMMSVTACADHRVVDGVAAARFLNDLKTTLENPYLLI